MEEATEESEWLAVDLYTVLGIERDASPDEIKKQYRKRALETHPDRGGNIEEFKRLAKAKDVLGDPQKRKYYDVYGEDGVEFYERWSSANPNEMLGQVGAGGIVCFCITNTICVAFLLCVPVFLILREDDWMWGWMMAPLWVIDALVLLMLTITPLLPYNMNKRGDLLSTCMWAEMLQMVCFITWQAFVAINLDHDRWIDWLTAFTPMFVFQAISSVKMIRQCLPEQYQIAHSTKVAGAGCGQAGFALYLSVQEAAWWAAWLLIPLRMDKSIDMSWWVVASPLFLLVAFGLFGATRDSRRARALDDTDEVVYEQAFSRWKFACWLFALATVIVVVLYIEGTVDSGIYFVFIPMFVVAGAFLMAVYYASVCLIVRGQGSEAQSGERHSDMDDNECSDDREREPFVDPEANFDRTDPSKFDAY